MVMGSCHGLLSWVNYSVQMPYAEFRSPSSHIDTIPGIFNPVLRALFPFKYLNEKSALGTRLGDPRT